MTRRYDRDQILAGLILDVAECLQIEPDEVVVDGSFFGDLGGESIEILDLTFRIRKRFGISIRQEDLMEGWDRNEDGQLTAEAIVRLHERLPGIDWTSRLGDRPIIDPRDMLTIDVIAEVVYMSQSDPSSCGR
ncbi:acyl carrier protein [Schlesneria paludicola]|uniref:acyl carrier protein n=1 Tax=Schlesneria paludicola TaxID=360056 RepID=UPI00029B4F71|nr:acyl carrier protein [Schlesneria paludicola]